MLIWLLWSASVMGSCGNRNESVPADILKPAAMEDLLLDLELAGAAGKIDLLPENYTYRKDKIFLDLINSHNTDTIQFRKSLEYYIAHPKLYEKIYNGVVKRLEEIPTQP